VDRIVGWIQEVLVPSLGPAGVFLAAFLDSSFLSLPEINDLLVVTGSAADPSQGPLLVLMATLGSLGGCATLWFFGRRGGEALLRRRFGAERVDRTRRTFERFGVLSLAIPAVLPPPMPFKIFVLSAGVFEYPFARFAATLLLARGVRYGLWAVAGILYGDEARELLRSFDGWVAANAWPAGLVLLAGVLTWILVRNVRRRTAREEADLV
jgi:membrane protein YqaA with SNARE-associated domain